MPTRQSERLKAWQTTIKLAAKKAMLGKKILKGPLSLTGCFYRGESVMLTISELAELGTGWRYDIKRPDLTNLIKAAEDAMIGIVYEDDSQIVYYDGIDKVDTKP